MSRVKLFRMIELDEKNLEDARQIIKDMVHIDVSDSVILSTALHFYAVSLRRDPDLAFARTVDR